MSKGRQYVDAPEGYEGSNKWINWRGYKIMVGPGRSPFLLNALAMLIKQRRLVTMMVSGVPGSGKSWWALRTAEILDPDFDPELQIAMTRERLLELMADDSPLKRGQVILCDEAQFMLSNRNWYDQVQKDLLEQMEAIRSRGFIIIIVALHIKLMDAVVRNHILSHFIYLENPGVATIYKLFTGRFDNENKYYRLGQTQLRIPGYDDRGSIGGCVSPDCLICRDSGLSRSMWVKRERWSEVGFRPCVNIKPVYERLKKHQVGIYNKASIAKLKAKAKKKLTNGQYCDILVPLLEVNSDTLLRDKDGRVNTAYLIRTLESETGVELSRSRIYQIRKMYELDHPPIKET